MDGMTSNTPDPDPQAPALPDPSTPAAPTSDPAAPGGDPTAPQWAWARPAPQPEWVETPPLAYHQLLRGVRRYRWWKPLLALVLGIVYYLTLSVAFGLLIIVPWMLQLSEIPTEADIMALARPDTQNPISMLLTLGSVALMIPAAMLAMLSVGLSPASRLWSVALRIRWGLIARTLLPALAALVVMNGLGIALEIALAGGVDDGAAFEAVEIDPGLAMWSALLVVLLVPIQATAEELVYRGMFMQTLGAWLGGVRAANALGAFLRGPWPAIVITALAFGFSHIYTLWGWLAVTTLGLAAGWVTWRTGGLEAAISLHVVNNFVAFGFLLFAFGGETAQTPDAGGGIGSFVGTVAGLALYVWWVDRSFSRRDGRRTRIDVVEAR